jgi:DNA-directed RNA polymerase specialized sigma24 family protein
MDAETVRTITTAAITAVSTLGAAGIVSYFGHRNQRLSADTTKLKESLQKRNRQLAAAYRHVSAYYQLEQLYSAELSAKTGEAQKTLKSRIRGAVEAKGFERPEWTSGECNQSIKELET